MLDNAGFELFTDLCFADWLVSCTPFCSRVVFSAKALPWFVSDVMPKGASPTLLSDPLSARTDFAQILDHLRSPSFFTSYTPSEAESNALSSLVDRWQSLISNGTLSLAPVSPFWTGPSAFSALPTESPELLSELQKASLVIFKVRFDLSCCAISPAKQARTGRPQLSQTYGRPDMAARYAFRTSARCVRPGQMVIHSADVANVCTGPLRGKIDLLTLRTCKADVVVGLAAGAYRIFECVVVLTGSAQARRKSSIEKTLAGVGTASASLWPRTSSYTTSYAPRTGMVSSGSRSETRRGCDRSRNARPECSTKVDSSSWIPLRTSLSARGSFSSKPARRVDSYLCARQPGSSP